jgi:hypothetical protein
MNSLQKNNPGTPPDHTTHDPLARMQARLSSYIAPRRDGLAAPPTPDDPAGRLASPFRQSFGLLRTRTTSSPEDIKIQDGFRWQGWPGAYDPELSGLDEASYFSIFVACDSTAHDTA